MYKLGILGCGNMGQAFLVSLIKAGVYDPDDIMVCNRTTAKNQLIRDHFRVATTSNLSDLERINTIILGIKPQSLPDIGFTPSRGTLLISLLAGTTIQKLAHKFGSSHKIVRLMPNIGQYYGYGMTGVFAEAGTLDEHQKILVDKIASAGAQRFWLKKETDMNNLTAISGCGPAYFFAFAENIKRSAQNLGFSEEEAFGLVRQTFLGAAEYIKTEPKNFYDSVLTVASKGGVTEQALKKMKEEGLEHVVWEGVQSAVKKSDQF